MNNLPASPVLAGKGFIAGAASRACRRAAGPHDGHPGESAPGVTVAAAMQLAIGLLTASLI